jgi:hypothetical protein
MLDLPGIEPGFFMPVSDVNVVALAQRCNRISALIYIYGIYSCPRKIAR